MKFASLPIYQNKTVYFLNSFSGSLLSKETEIQKKPKEIHSEKVIAAIKQCNNPYLLNIEKISSESSISRPYLINYGRRLTNACTSAFWLARAITFFGKPAFKTTSDAIMAYRKMYFYEDQNDLCLPRTLFAASTSKTFKKHGVVFIGVFLPSRNMHAWIIEDGLQPDPYDTMWINYQPVAIIY
jgi:hypothetical protein